MSNETFEQRIETAKARDEVIKASLRVASARMCDESSPSFDADIEYHEDQLDIAARNLIRAKGSLVL